MKVFNKWAAGLYVIYDKYQGWAVNKGHLFIVRLGGVIKIIVGKDGYKSLRKALHNRNEQVNLLFECYMSKPYETKKMLNDMLKSYKINNRNNYEYRINDKDLFKILVSADVVLGYPMHGELANDIANYNPMRCNTSVNYSSISEDM